MNFEINFANLNLLNHFGPWTLDFLELLNAGRFSDFVKFFEDFIAAHVQVLQKEFLIGFVEGNIAAGKSTWLKTKKMTISEPLKMWESTCLNDENILSLFYKDITSGKEYCPMNFKFEIFALFSRLVFIFDKLYRIDSVSKKTIWCERSFLSDR